MVNARDIWQQAAHAILYQVSFPSCSTRALQKKAELLTKNVGYFVERKKSEERNNNNNNNNNKNDKTEKVNKRNRQKNQRGDRKEE